MSKLKAVIIGCGNIAGGYDSRSGRSTVMTHAGGFSQSSEIDLEGAFDPNHAQLEAFCKEWQTAQSASVNELLATHRPDIVSICTPNETHFPLFREVAAFKPKAIICEKPISLEVNEASAMVEQAEKENILLVVNYMRRWDPALAEVKALFKNKAFGKIQGGRVIYTKGIFHNASHGINLLQDWFGPVEGMEIVRAKSWQPRDPGGDFILWFPNDVEIYFQWANTESFSLFEIDILAEKARVLLGGGGNSISIFEREQSAIVPGTFGLSGKANIIPATLGLVMKEVCGNLASAILGGEKLKMPARDALATVEVCAQLRDLQEGK